MAYSILYREGNSGFEETACCSDEIPTYTSRTLIPEHNTIIGRYSVLPFYHELEMDLSYRNARLINDITHHRYLAEIPLWYPDLEEFTPKTWSDWANLPDNTSFVIKGITNSRKFNWNELMFCKDKTEVPVKANKLLDDTLIGQQGIVVREYVPLKKLDEGMNGLPISNEWRVFYLNGKIIDYGFYWSEWVDDEPKTLDKKAFDLLERVVPIVGNNARFYVIDIAETATGDWIVIELNDAQMAGLSAIPPCRFYKNLKQALTDQGY